MIEAQHHLGATDQHLGQGYERRRALGPARRVAHRQSGFELDDYDFGTASQECKLDDPGKTGTR
jgi:hypothetical protein